MSRLTDWAEARSEWTKFEDEAEQIRNELGCSFRGAWFRGHEKESWPLLPCAFRRSAPAGLSDSLADFGGRPPMASELRQPRPLALDKPVDASLGVIEADVAAHIRRLCGEIQQLCRQVISLQRQIDDGAAAAGKTLRDDAQRSAAKAAKRERASLDRRRSDLTETMAHKRAQVMTLRALRYGEKDAYTLFRTRTTVQVGNSSWETLAAMQHYGAPTRLLDWTDTLAVAVYFATKDFRAAMVGAEGAGSIANWLEVHPKDFDPESFSGLSVPSVWVMNPYRLARWSGGYNSVEDLSIRDDLDYFTCFHARHSWPYASPLPVTLPWRTARMAAQRGYFTVHGNDVRSLNEQLLERTVGAGPRIHDPVLGKVMLTPSAAIYAVRYVVQFVGLDSFTLFRDEDNLGVLLQEFMSRN